MFKIEFSKLTVLYIGLAVIVLAGVGFYISRVIIPQVMPATLILPVPFTSQAPTNDWSRNEDCEETSITMANAYLNGQTQDRMSATDAQNAINQLKGWEQINIGYNANTGADATSKMAEGAFEIKINQVANFTEADLKNALIDQHPILLPINAKLLPNTHYANGGPLYHMIIIRGFRGDTFIVNDPGTDSGDGNEYTFSVLQSASADWNEATKSIDPTRKIALVASK